MPADTVETVTNDTDEKSRNAIIQAADPFFPHTFWRAVLMAATLALTMLGFTTVISVVFAVGTAGLFHVVSFFVQGAGVAAFAYFGRGFREQILVTQGKIPEKDENL